MPPIKKREGSSPMLNKIAASRYAQLSTSQLEGMLHDNLPPDERAQVREELTRRYRDYYYDLATQPPRRGNPIAGGTMRLGLTLGVGALVVVLLLVLLVLVF
jgi:hypothetical protein